jgi:RNA exonuclease 4
LTRAVWDKMESACGATVAEIKQYGDGVMGKSMVSRLVKKPCACCHKLFADDPALEAHWELVQHSAHDAVCASCGRHFPSYDTLRQHLIGKLPKESCAAAFATRGCKTCLEIFENEEEENAHACVFREREGETQRVGDAPCVALDCEFVGVGEDGSENACARVCIVDAWGETVLNTWVNPGVDVVDYRHDITGATPEALASAPKLADVRAKVLGILLGKSPTTHPLDAGVKHLVVGHSIDHDLRALKITWKACRQRDTARFPLYLRHTHLPFKLRALAETFLDEKIQAEGQAHDPEIDARCSMRLYQAAKRRSHAVAHKWFAKTLAADPVEASSTSDPARGIALLRQSINTHGATRTSRFWCWCHDIGATAPKPKP